GMVLSSVELWNEQIDGFVSSILWEPHYVAGLIACITAYFLIACAPRRARWIHGVFAGVAMASALGLAIWIALVFAIFLAAWTLILWNQRRPEASVIVAACIVGTVLSIPFLTDMRAPAVGGAALQWTVRSFRWAEIILKGQGLAQWWRVT